MSRPGDARLTQSPYDTAYWGGNHPLSPADAGWRCLNVSHTPVSRLGLPHTARWRGLKPMQCPAYAGIWVFRNNFYSPALPFSDLAAAGNLLDNRLCIAYYIGALAILVMRAGGF